jgi:phospholipid transport system substrate-binding protein
MNRRFWVRMSAALLLAATASSGAWAQIADEAPDALVRRLSTEVLDAIRGDKSLQSGDAGKIVTLVETKVIPHVNFERMTASAVGPGWRQATAEQRKRLQDEFKTLLVRTYAGALSQVTDQTIVVKPLRAAADDREVVVRTEVKGRGDPIQLDYRVEKPAVAGAGWKIYNINVLGVWLVEAYKSQFAQEINAKGLDGLIASLVERNRANAKKG